jgi:alginate O-acetyltransferase complex protein AlgI
MPVFNTIGYFLDLFALLPIALLLYYAMPRAWAQKLLLILLGVGLLAALAPRLALFYLGFWTVVALLQGGLSALRTGGPRRIGLAMAIVLLLAPLELWKLFPDEFLAYYNVYLNAFISALYAPLGLIDLVKAVVIPIGISFSTFRAIDLLVQTHLGVVARQRWLDIFAYGFFPPIQVVGPVAEYREVSLGFDEPKRASLENLREGTKRILIGLFKLYALSYPLSGSADLLAGLETTSAVMLWCRLGLFTWYFYLNFAGFSDIAIGSARLLGFTLAENFDRPFFQQGPQQYWNHWHMSLTRFAQRNVFVPAGGYRARTQYRAIFATMLVIALWHDLSIGMVIFGLYHAMGIALQRAWESSRPRRSRDTPEAFVAPFLRGFGTYVFVGLSFPLLVVPSTELASFYLALVGVH